MRGNRSRITGGRRPDQRRHFGVEAARARRESLAGSPRRSYQPFAVRGDDRGAQSPSVARCRSAACAARRHWSRRRRRPSPIARSRDRAEAGARAGSAARASSPSVTPADVTALRAAASIVSCRVAIAGQVHQDAVAHIPARPSRSRPHAARASAAVAAAALSTGRLAHCSSVKRSASSAGNATADGTIRYTPAPSL